MLALSLGSIGLVAGPLPLVHELEEILGLGALFTFRGAMPPPADVVVVGISRESAQALGQSTELDTWPRELHGRLVERLTSAGATTIAFDLMFHEARGGPGDAMLAAAMAASANVVLLEETGDSDAIALGEGSTAWREQRTPPLPMLKEAALGSAPFILPTVPVRIGQSWTFDRVTDELPSLPVLALQGHLLAYYDDFVALIERARPGSTVRWPQTRAEVEAQGALERVMGSIRRTLRNDRALGAAAATEIEKEPAGSPTTAALEVMLDLYAGANTRYLNFYGPARAITTVPYDAALSGSGQVDLSGKVVLVGVSEPRQPRQQDYFYSVFSERSGINLSGVEVGATVIGNLLERRTLNALALPQHVALLVSFGLVVGFVLGRTSLGRAAGATLLIAAGYSFVASWQFENNATWLPLAVPLLLQLPLGFVVVAWWSYREAAAQRERVQTALGYYVPKSVARRLSDAHMSIGTDRELLHGTCLVTDAEHYTSVAERLAPADLAGVMNDYYDAIFRVVQAHGGDISDTAGDSMIAVWATAAPDGATRLRATEAAIAILSAVDDFNRTHPHAPLPTRIGLETGEMLLGNIGAEQRYEYRAIGDIVNTASRIQGLNQLLGTRVLVSAATLEGVTTLETRDVGTFLLRGKRSPVRVLEPLVTRSSPLDEAAQLEFAAAMRAFRAAAWREAHERFAALASRCSSDGPARYYEALAREWSNEPPPHWSGAVRLSVK